MSIVALVPATGRTGQFGDIDAVAGIPLLGSVLRNVLASDCIDLVGLVVASSEVDAISEAITEFDGKPIQGIGVDAHVFESTYSIIAAGLRAIPGVSVALLHDLRHAYAPPDLIRRVVDEVRAGAPAVVPVLPCTDTVKELDESGVIINTPDRAALRVTQAPVGFAANLWQAEERAWRRLPPGARTIAGHPAARAIRTSFDLAFARDSSDSTDSKDR